MSSLLPLASYNLALNPFVPTQAIESDLPVTVRITLAAIDPTHPVDDDEEPSTLRILKSSVFSQLGDDLDDESDDELDEDNEDDELNADEDESDDDDEDVKDGSDDEEEQGSDDSDSEGDSDDDLDDDVEEYVVCTLSPKTQYQQTLDLTINPEEEVYFVVTGSYPIHISGNYVEHPFDDDEDDYDDEDGLYGEDSDEDYDLTPDEDELLEADYDIDNLEDEDDVSAKIQELVDEEAEASKKEEKPKKESKKAKKEAKRKAEEAEAEDKKQSKKQKQQEKNVQFNKALEEGPTKSGKTKPVTKTLAGGVVIEDRTIGKGPTAKNGSKVGVRYLGKLKNGSVFDKNTSGKPFNFNLGKGEVIKGWDIGVVGMAVGGERRIVIPAPFAYGKKKLPGIPANSELTFDVKLVALK